LAAVLLVLSVAVTLLAAPLAPADELDERRDRVHEKIDHARGELRHSSRALARAGARVERAEARLAAAERHLEQRRAELAAAEVHDRRMQAELEAATARLQRAQEALSRGRASHRRQEDSLRAIAAETYQSASPDLLGLTMVLTSDTPTELTNQLNVVRNVLDREEAALRRLEASGVLLQLQRDRVAAARADVARQRRAAAESLDRKEQMESRAAAAAGRVERALQVRERARAEAARAKREDARRLRQLKNERDEIAALIRRREARLARQRSRAALARAREASRSRTAPLLTPVNSYITSHYGMRLHPVYHAWRLHDGTDFGAACGTPIRAAAGGRVIGRYYDAGYGHRVIVAHGYRRGVNLTTTYNHLSRYSSHVGQRVQRGEVIGFVGTTGYSTGCHLHFMVFQNGRTVNPLKWL
jgi:murein DD-endopeptidase MepM/ murein hydrolase activator NlpD